MRGGLHLLAHKDRSVLHSIAFATVPKKLLLTSSRSNQSRETLVSVGQRVQLGELLSRSDDDRLHSSVSGTVLAVESRNERTIVAIENDGLDDRHASIEPLSSFANVSAGELRERIQAGGIVGLGGAMFSTAAKLSAAANHGVQQLIVNGAECEPFITCDDALMRERADDIIFGTQALMHACGAATGIIAVEANKPEAIASVSKAAAADNRIEVRRVGDYYPAGGERQLIKTILGIEVPSGSIPPTIGVLCQNVGTAAAVAQLIKCGEPMVSRVVTITGSGIARPQNFYVRFGTPIASVIGDAGGYSGRIERLIMGGPMMGIALESDEPPVTAATNCIIAATAEDLALRRPEMPCIRCGECSHSCPAHLLPQQLLRFARLRDVAALKELGLNDCIECGCCDYVCPSQIPLTSSFIAAKLLP